MIRGAGDFVTACRHMNPLVRLVAEQLLDLIQFGNTENVISSQLKNGPFLKKYSIFINHKDVRRLREFRQLMLNPFDYNIVVAT